MLVGSCGGEKMGRFGHIGTSGGSGTEVGTEAGIERPLMSVFLAPGSQVC